MTLSRVSPFPVISEFADLFDDDPQFARMVRRAELLSHARALPRWLKGNAVDLVLILLAGQDLGLSTWESINSFYPDDTEESGLALHSSAKRVLLARAGWGWRIVEATDERCTVAITNPDRPEQGELFATYTMHDAIVAELTSGPRARWWRHHPRRMLYARVSGLIIDTNAAHIISGGRHGWGAVLPDDPAPTPVATPHTAPSHAPAEGPGLPNHTQPRSSAEQTPTAAAAAPEHQVGPAADRATTHPPTPTTRITATPAVIAPSTEPEPEATNPRTTPPPSALPAPDEPAEPKRAPTHPAVSQPSPEARSEPSETSDPLQRALLDSRQAAWELLRGHAALLAVNGVYQILLGNAKRTAKEKRNGRLTDETEQAIHQARITLDVSAHTIYRQLRKSEPPASAAPDQSPPVPLEIAPQPQMPDVCGCEDDAGGPHHDDCPDAGQ
ncbi:hypothetical protein ACFVYP_36690 [Kitasatospora sp. NPDC058201]|uniref:hypothetical protein n=1 Tax=unclassified Kitasatospora TaxID=2633591 RepID=UPI0036609A33